MADSTQPIPVAVIGVGYLGRFHAQKYAMLPQCRLVGVVDADASRAQQVGEELGVPAYTDASAILSSVEAVSVAVPTGLHHSITTQCLEAGAHVLVEKPLTAQVSEARSLLKTAARMDQVLQVGHLERFNPAVQAIHSSVGTLRFVEAIRIASFKERGSDVDVVLDLMSHDLDLLLSWVSAPIRQIHAVGVSVLTDHIDLANARLIFEDGCVANLTASRISAKAERRLRLFQDDAYFSLDLAKPSVRLYTSKVVTGSRPPTIVKEEHPTLESADALLLEIEAFLKAVRGTAPPPVSGAAGIAVVELAERIVEDIIRNRPT